MGSAGQPCADLSFSSQYSAELVQALFRRGQLKALVDAHAETEGLGGHLSADEISIIRGALDLTSKTAASCMTPLDKVPPFSSSFLSRGCLVLHYILYAKQGFEGQSVNILRQALPTKSAAAALAQA